MTRECAKVLIEQWRSEYNQIRPRCALGYRPPAPEAILAEAKLSFLGIGNESPDVVQGAMVSNGYRYLNNKIFSFPPGVAVMLVVFSFSVVGDVPRDAPGPRLRKLL